MTESMLATAPVLATPHPDTLLRITVHGIIVHTETHPDIPETWNSICALTRLGYRVTIAEL
jgi:hypothetical protein